MVEWSKEIRKLIQEVAEENDTPLQVELKDDTVLLQSGLDSLGFAILVAKIEEIHGVDPFTSSDIAQYPRTLKDFVSFYENSNEG